MKKASLAATTAILAALSRQELLGHFLSINTSAGYTAYERLNGDVDAVGLIGPPSGYSAVDWIERERLVAVLGNGLGRA